MTARITHILVPVDFSDASRMAMHYGGFLALKLGAKLTAAHVVPSFGAFNYAFPGDTYEFEKKVFAEAGKQLPNEIPQKYGDRLKTETLVRAGDVRDELLAVIKREATDLIVMGTHGRRAVERLILGSTTESLLRRVPVPILTV